MSDMQCPYCHVGQHADVEFENSEDVPYEHECSKCGKHFVYTIGLRVYYEPRKADCLNGADHKMKFLRAWPKKYSRIGCKHCAFERIATADEIAAHGIKG